MSFVDELVVVPLFLLGLWFCSSLSKAVFRVRCVGSFWLVSTGESRRRPGRAPSFSSSCCSSRSRLWRLPCFLVGGPAPGSLASRWLPWPPGVGCDVVLALCVFVVPGVCLRGACLWHFRRFRCGLAFWPFCSLYVLRGASQVERFVACILRHLPQVVFPSWRVASEFFWLSQLQIQEAAERRGLHRLR